MPEVVIVTGGSRGIGAATARLAACRGYSVCLSYAKQEDAAAGVIERISGRGGQARAVRTDVSVEADVLALFEAAGEMGPVTALVNNAGVLARQARVEDMAADRLQRVLAVNVTGAFLCAREAIRVMSTRHGGGGGAIVNVSSRAAILGSAGEYVDYAASKAAVDALTVGMAREVAAEGVRVNGVRPGLIETDIHASGGEPGRVARLRDTVPMGRGGRAEEVAESILWLLSPQASYVTGSVVDVSGGR